ncbi:TetR/AcrR family transcriptional regulator [Rhodopseudomonas palustris]|uniref:TetR/AcrR family transcriptional regulator n=1 Tax=Rhodopseudomonas palustris (strain ATCC BAA-98 / CGA009) TaxID=258594 RepID=Q6N2G5_RHOPA|nr:TetR/AcrR family transcriptional regulator [Rhodopseudomonas palustris]OPF92509.1 TetR family transcriptional regulator [Rhodopseudomonas palustris]WAB76976.1 TetR/AcrR family transcriptional regulator [Rhodopseudomonas palustris]WCL94271.1 TetR/AcrR family transcriptional regulator [Rhodopseudomonas palustris CGA009]WND50888.1 TetR/AcrR family transcriptional regulator [Rhodopseudomonas palustris]CAE29526.1 transcriptional regulator, TetR family [Rhodopseudomonas palustris CGA009]
MPRTERPAMTPKGGKSSQKILESAFKCIALRGCNNVTLREIADEAGVALSQLHYYYKNKDGLFNEVLKGMRERYSDGLGAKLSKSATRAEKIRDIIDYNRELLRNQTDLYRNFLEFFNLAMRSDEFGCDVNQFIDDIAAAISVHLSADLADAATSRRSENDALARMILASSFGIAMQYLLNRESADILAGFDILAASLNPARRYPEPA